MTNIDTDNRDDHTFLLPPRVRALANLAGQNSVRCALHGVLLSRAADGYVAYAANGYSAARVRGSFPEPIEDFPDLPALQPGPRTGQACSQALIPAVAWKEGLALAKSSRNAQAGRPSALDNVLVKTYASETGFGSTNLERTRTISIRNLVARFPDVEMVIPQKPADLSVCLDIDRLIDLLKVAREFTCLARDGGRAVHLELRQGNGPIVVKTGNGALEFLGLLTPLEPGQEVAQERAARSDEAAQQDGQAPAPL